MLPFRAATFRRGPPKEESGMRSPVFAHPAAAVAPV